MRAAVGADTAAAAAAARPTVEENQPAENGDAKGEEKSATKDRLRVWRWLADTDGGSNSAQSQRVSAKQKARERGESRIGEERREA